MDMLSSTTHLHITMWVVGIILFFVAYAMKPSAKGRKIVHMILRVFYLLIIASGIFLFIGNHGLAEMAYGIKIILGLVVIAMMELALVKSGKGQNGKPFLIGFIIVFIITFLLGSYLPLGINFLWK